MGRSYDNGADYYRQGPHAPFVEAIRSPADAPVHLMIGRAPEGAYPDPPLPEISLQVCPSWSFGHGIQWDVGTGRREGRFRPQQFLLAPANTYCNYEIVAPGDLLTLNVPTADAIRLLSPARPAFTGDLGRPHGPLLSDPFVSTLAERMWDEAANDTPLGRLFLDSAVLALLTALLARSEASHEDALLDQRGKPALAEWRLRRCLDYLHDNLGADIGLDELASAAGLSPVYFARQFKRATGHAPHQYLIRQRVERAKALLAGGDLPIAQVAFECGFSGQEHLTSMFRKVTGTTPGTYRRAMRN